MGLMDKVKAQAEQAMAKAQQGVAQGQAKLDTMQAKKQADALLRDLGAAYYAEQRESGPQAAVAAALAQVDAHVAEHGALDLTPAAPTPGSPTVPSASPPPDAAGPSYTLDDL